MRAISRQQLGVVGLLIWTVLSMLPLSLWASADNAHYQIHADAKSLSFTKVLDYWSQTSNVLGDEDFLSTAASLPWQRTHNQTLNLSRQENPVWLRFTLQTGDLNDNRWFIRLQWPTLTQVRLLMVDNDTQALLQRKDWSQSSLETIDPVPAVLPVELPSDSNLTVYLMVSSPDMLIVPVTLYRADAYQEWMQWRNLSVGLFFGSLLAMLFYNLSLYGFLRDASYAVYCCYVVSIMAYVAMMSGFGSALIWHDYPGFNEKAYGLFASTAFLAAACFIRTFLGLPRYGGILNLLGNMAVISWILIIILHLFTSGSLSLTLVHAMGVVSCFVGLGVSIYLWWFRGDVSARYMSIAWSPLIAATFVLMLGLNGVISYGIWQNYLQNFGFVIEVILLSMALGERVSREKKLKLAAQTMSLRHSLEASAARDRELKAQARVLELERDARIALEDKVAERTRELEAALESLESANAELSLLSRTDALTGLANRRKFDEQLFAEVNRCARFELPFALLMIDIDHFKRINDTYGHTAGDECLKMIGKVIRANVSRTEDLVARYGGEEFCILIVGAELQAAAALAEKIRRQTELSTCSYGDFKLRFTVSIGVYSGVPELGAAPEELVNLADNQLYMAKKKGRNRVELTSNSEVSFDL